MEEEKGKICPKCGVENPVTRVTCQVCHEKLGGKVNPFINPQSELPLNNAPVEELTKEKVKKTRKTRQKKITKALAEKPAEVPTTKEKPARKRVTHRRKRRVTKGTTEPTFFVFTDGKLTAVNITWGVMRPIKRKSLPAIERSILSLVNRNKSLLDK